MAWRVARSLEVLTAEVQELHPGTTVWTIGDATHRASASDHNPNAADVVCAGDFLPDRGLDLHWFSRRVVASRHPALKYVIYNRQIWSAARASEGWRPYGGSNPHTGHGHVSVGEGPDGRSTGPYDDTSPWGLVEEDDMAIDNDDVKRFWTRDNLLPAPDSGLKRWPNNKFWAAWSALRFLVDAAWPSVTSQWEALWPGEGPTTTVGVAARRAAISSRLAREDTKELLAGQAAIIAAVAGQDVGTAIRAELTRHRGQLLAELRGELAELVEAAQSGEREAGEVVDEIARRLAGDNEPA